MKGIYYHTKASVDEYIQLAKDVNSAKLIKKFESFLPDNPLILELGTGPGTDWNIMCQSHNIVGSDNSKEFLKRLSQKYPDGEFLELDAVSLDTHREFNAIYSNKVLHHLDNEALLASIKRQAEILDSGSVVCHSFWKGIGDEYFKHLYVNYHEEEELRQLFSPQFEILLLEAYVEFSPDDSIVLIARKK